MKEKPYLTRVAIFCCLAICTVSSSIAQQDWRGLTIAGENRCSPYDKKKQYPYPQAVEDEIVARMDGNVYGPYTGRYFVSDTQTDIEHIVAASEGHDSGLCAASPEQRRLFAIDLLNLTLAAPVVNRCGIGGKCGLDAAEWMPKKNKCWFANRVVEIKTKYNLSVDKSEAKALEMVLGSCDSYGMIFFPKLGQLEANTTAISSLKAAPALLLYDDNSNGRITCKEARAHGIAPVYKGHLAYDFMNDSDRDGVVCE